jgi:hypothetical protein
MSFIQAFTQAPIGCPIYMEIPAGSVVQNGRLVFAEEARTGMRVLQRNY